MPWVVYILQSKKDEGYYIGCTKDIDKRLKQHNSGYCKSTRFRKPFVLLCTERYNTQAEAYGREKQIKKYKGGNAFKKILAECVGGGACPAKNGGVKSIEHALGSVHSTE